MAAALCCTPPALGADLEGIRTHQAPDHTRVVFDTSEAVRYKVFTLENPHRVVIDLKRTRPREGFQAPKPKGDAISRIRLGRRLGGTHRIVLDMAWPARPRHFPLQPHEPYGHRLVVDLYSAEAEETPRPAPAAPSGERDVLIALDAGHGGEDPGAIAATGAHEKDIVLAIAKRVHRNLNAMDGFKAVLVRSGDYYVPLRRRTEIAYEHQADLFVSIHADAFRLASVRGASVYALSNRGASSEMAGYLADRENRSDLIGGVGPVPLDAQPDSIRSLLIEKSMEMNMLLSLRVGEAVVGSLSEVAKMHKRRVEQAAFAVLKLPDVPSILVETGFLSNPQEARLLATAGHQRRIAGAIADGIRGYLLKNPPPGTAIFAADQTLRHTIGRGDTISAIAARYRVSTGVLRAANGLTGDTIQVGQVLVIPGGS